MKKTLILGFAMVFGLAACNKDQDAGSTSPYQGITSTADLTAPSNFSWKTTRIVSLDISALSGYSSEKQAISVQDSEGNLLLSRLMTVEENSTVHFQVTNSTKSVTVIHDGVAESVKLSAGNFSRMMVQKQGQTSTCPCDGRMRSFTVVYHGNAPTTFYLRQKARKQTYPLVYSIPNVNPGDTVTFNGFDKQGRLKSQSFVEIDGVVYNIHTSCSQNIVGLTFGPITVLSYTDGNGAYCGPPVNPPCVDTDGDGCCDPVDAFPNDPTKCDIQYVPGKNVYGSYAWEDLWPTTGDFDFNDKVIDRNTALIVDQNGDVTEAVYKFVLKAAGASFENGFGFALPGIPSATVSSVSGTKNDENYTVIGANGTEMGQTDAVIIVYENWKNIVTYTQNGAFFNTLKNSGISEGRGFADTITVTVQFASPQVITSVLEIDPFLIRDGVRGSEVHLPWFGPTDLADVTLFGTKQDASAYPGLGNNYVNASNIPWAIETPLSAYEWPIEKTDIVTVYFDFAMWAMTGTPTNWYSNGNRDASKLY